MGYLLVLKRVVLLDVVELLHSPVKILSFPVLFLTSPLTFSLLLLAALHSFSHFLLAFSVLLENPLAVLLLEF